MTLPFPAEKVEVYKQRWLSECETYLVVQGHILRTQHLVLCSSVTVMKFLISFKQGASHFILHWALKTAFGVPRLVPFPLLKRPSFLLSTQQTHFSFKIPDQVFTPLQSFHNYCPCPGRFTIFSCEGLQCLIQSYTAAFISCCLIYPTRAHLPRWALGAT